MGKMQSPPFETLDAALHNFTLFLQTLTSRAVPLMSNLATPRMHYKDPFHDVHGADDMIEIYKRMFERYESLSFKVTDRAWGQDGQTAYIRWTMHYGSGRKRKEIDGISEILFTTDGRVASHISHWDSTAHYYADVPVLGALIKFAKSKYA